VHLLELLFAVGHWLIANSNGAKVFTQNLLVPGIKK
jgi:hypothetical protein